MADRVYCPDAARHPDGGGALEVRGDEARHLVRVRRVGVGEVVEVFDGRGHARAAEVVGLGKDRVALRPFGPPLPDRVAPVGLTLATAVPKGDRFDWLVEKAAELGVAALAPILTARSVVDPRGAKLDRLRRAVVEAAKQCGRNRLMTVEDPAPWAELVKTAAGDALRLVAHPGGAAFPDWPRPSAAVVVAVGPEGGFTEAEVEAAVTGGWIPVSLGDTLLRVETAGLVVASRVLALAEGEGKGARGAPAITREGSA